MIIAKMGKQFSRKNFRFYKVYAVESEVNNRVNYLTDFDQFIIMRSEENTHIHTHGDMIKGELWEMPFAIKYMKSAEEKVELMEVYDEFEDLKRLGGAERWRTGLA